MTYAEIAHSYLAVAPEIDPMTHRDNRPTLALAYAVMALVDKLDEFELLGVELVADEEEYGDG